MQPKKFICEAAAKIVASPPSGIDVTIGKNIMAKKTIIPKTTDQGASPLEPTGVPTVKPARKKAAKSKTAATAKNSGVAQAAASRTVVKAVVVTKPGPTAASITPADIALRAYFIAEKRQKLGLPGDSTSDWMEAERQLKAEAVAKPVPK